MIVICKKYLQRIISNFRIHYQFRRFNFKTLVMEINKCAKTFHKVLPDPDCDLIRIIKEFVTNEAQLNISSR